MTEAVAATRPERVRYSREGSSGPEAAIAEALSAPLAFLGVGLPDDRSHAPDEKVELPMLHRGAEAVAHLWRPLGQAAPW